MLFLSTVSPGDFPDTETIRRRLHAFESHFVQRFTSLYSSLPETVQLSAVSIAVRRGLSAADHAPVSLWQYLRSAPSDLPLDLPSTHFALTVSPEHFRRIQGLRHADSDVIALLRDLVSSLATDAAAEISRAFEYQIALLGDGLPGQLLPTRAADCVMDYLKRSNRHVDVNALVSGAVQGRKLSFTRLDSVRERFISLS
jgi:hypothetical protein